ncbi:hypothetical protein [Rhizobium ruizarguesonis]|uniref:hypothetical protein n=1 Tax=Rhizobium ruizarguesonis TaxID=2081791 RepID=UPI001031FEB4|nr:hypothetical protein [Rhizobium ruizarguesonis]TBD21836.1 hypothetical protein ELH23_13585 [Rhizobium ruizarguesonis]
MRRLGLIMMLLGLAGTVIGILGSVSPWALEFNVWLNPNFLADGQYPEIFFVYLSVLFFLLWFFGALIRNHRPSQRPRE